MAGFETLTGKVKNTLCFTSKRDNIFITDRFCGQGVFEVKGGLRQPMRINNEKGYIDISNDVFTAISGCAATNCFGVKGMAVRSVTDGLVHLLRNEAMSKGVRVTFDEGGQAVIDLHIIVEHGVNIVALSRSIMSEVSYHVSRLTGTEAKAVNVFVDSIMID